MMTDYSKNKLGAYSLFAIYAAWRWLWNDWVVAVKKQLKLRWKTGVQILIIIDNVSSIN